MKIMGKKTNITTKATAPAKPGVKTTTKQPADRKAAAAFPKQVKSTVPKTRRASKPAAAKGAAITAEDIALRAYYIAEKRRHNGLPGDEHRDWIEAERQLRAERKSLK
jgi:Protein of unknown function (DUF2934)